MYYKSVILHLGHTNDLIIETSDTTSLHISRISLLTYVLNRSRKVCFEEVTVGGRSIWQVCLLKVLNACHIQRLEQSVYARDHRQCRTTSGCRWMDQPPAVFSLSSINVDVALFSPSLFLTSFRSPCLHRPGRCRYRGQHFNRKGAAELLR